MSNIAETIEYRDHEIEIHYDQDPMNPRKEWDNFGTMACVHRRYNLGDDQHKSSDDLLEALSGLSFYDAPCHVTYEDMVKRMQRTIESKYITLPLYLYDHSGISMSTSSLGCRWDSGMVGLIYVSLEDMRKEHNIRKVTKRYRKSAIALLESEVETYDHFLTGQVYGYSINGKLCNDSCWGYFGHDHKKNGLLNEAQSAIDWAINHEAERLAKERAETRANNLRQLKAWLINKVPLINRNQLTY
jgi:hypothetical protein